MNAALAPFDYFRRGDLVFCNIPAQRNGLIPSFLAIPRGRKLSHNRHDRTRYKTSLSSTFLLSREEPGGDRMLIVPTLCVRRQNSGPRDLAGRKGLIG